MGVFLRFLTLLLVLVASFPAPCRAQASGLVAAYSFEGNALDVSGNGNHGTIVGGVTFVPGVTGQAARFDGTSGYIWVPDNPLLRLDTFTLSAWVLLTELNGPARILEKGASDSYWLYLNPTGNVIAGFVDPTFHDLVSTTKLNLGIWAFVVSTYDGTTLRVYVDGDLSGSLSLSSTPVQTSEPLVLGWKYGGFFSDYLQGALDEVRIYNRALSAAEIEALMAAGSRVTFDDLAPAPGSVVAQRIDLFAFLGAAGWIRRFEHHGTPSDEAWLKQMLLSVNVLPVTHMVTLSASEQIDWDNVTVHLNGEDKTQFCLKEPFADGSSGRLILEHYWFDKAVTVTVVVRTASGYGVRRSWTFVVDTSWFGRTVGQGVLKAVLGPIIGFLEGVFNPRVAY